MSKAACKEIIDNGGRLKGTSLGFVATLEAQADSLLGFGVAETPAGDKWLDDVSKFQKKTQKEIDAINAEAMMLCMTQPIA